MEYKGITDYEVAKKYFNKTCCDCGKKFEIKSSSRRIRCDNCYKTERQRINRENICNYRSKNNM